MVQKKTIRLVGILLILILAFQLLPSLLVSFEGVDNHTENSKTYITIYKLTNHLSTFIQENRKPSLQILTIKTHWLYEYHVYSQSYSTQYFNLKAIILNIHQKTEYLISHYFNGSKYKDVNLFI